MSLTDHQEHELYLATSGRVGCLTGGPGTGKSFSLASYLARRSRKETVVCTPTGKAAARCLEVLRGYSITDVPVKTIHSLLRPRDVDTGTGSWKFTHSLHNPIPYKTIIVDESSMISGSLMASLLCAIEAGSRVLFVGDINQLPPVGVGLPFRDMMAAGIPTGRLAEIHRFAGRIATVCDAINKGQPWEPSPTVDLRRKDYPENFLHLERTTAPQIIDTLKKVIALCEEKGFSPLHDIQVLCPLRKSGPLSRDSLNPMLRRLLNRNIAGKDSKFVEGDKVICLKNGFAETLEDNGTENIFTWKDGGQSYQANGETGVVYAVGPSCIAVESTAGLIFVPTSSLIHYDHAYAMTVHKSQGSQWPVVISIIDDSHGADMVCSRQFWYTALSRASNLSITIGKRATLDRHCRTVELLNRKTFLKEEIQSCLQTSSLVNSA